MPFLNPPDVLPEAMRFIVQAHAADYLRGSAVGRSRRIGAATYRGVLAGPAATGCWR